MPSIQEIYADAMRQEGVPDPVRFRVSQRAGPELRTASGRTEVPKEEETRSRVVEDRLQRRFEAIVSAIPGAELDWEERLGPDPWVGIFRLWEDLVAKVSGLVDLITEDSAIVGGAELGAALIAANHSSQMRLAVPESDDSVRVLNVGEISSFLKATRFLLVTHKQGAITYLKDQQYTVAQNSESGPPDSSAPEAIRDALESFLARRGLSRATDDLKGIGEAMVMVDECLNVFQTLGTLAGLQEGLVRILGRMILRESRWPELIALHEVEVVPEFPWEVRLGDPPPEVRFALYALATAIGTGRPMELPIPAVSVRLMKDLDHEMFGVQLAVNDPWVPIQKLQKSLRDAMARIRAGTQVPRLTDDDLAFLEAVDAERESWKSEGRWPPELGNRRFPYGFWSALKARWAAENPDRELEATSLRVWHHRLRKKGIPNP